MTNTSSLNRRGAALIGVSIAVLGLAAGLVAWRQLAAPILDPVTLRDAGRPVSGKVAVLLDVTDPLDASQLAAVTEWLRELELTSLRPNEQVTAWVLGTMESGGLSRVFSRYYPGRESDAVLHNPATSAARCESLFSGPLREAVTRAANGPHFLRSPILEAIREVASQPEFTEGRGPRKLIVASDLEQNTATLSFYRSVPSFAAFWNSACAAPLRVDLHGVPVDVLYLPRGTAATTLGSSLEHFWRQYLTACGAKSVRIRRM